MFKPPEHSTKCSSEAKASPVKFSLANLCFEIYQRYILNVFLIKNSILDRRHFSFREFKNLGFIFVPDTTSSGNNVSFIFFSGWFAECRGYPWRNTLKTVTAVASFWPELNLQNISRSRAMGSLQGFVVVVFACLSSLTEN